MPILYQDQNAPQADRELGALLIEIQWELKRAAVHGEKFASLHEAYAVMAEELDEIWDITRMKRRDRDPSHIRKELIQLAAMTLKAAQSMENFIGGSV